MCGKKVEVVASGGAVRRIGVMKNIIGEVFAMPVSLSNGKEEASVGAALFGAAAQGSLAGIEEFSVFIS